MQSIRNSLLCLILFAVWGCQKKSELDVPPQKPRPIMLANECPSTPPSLDVNNVKPIVLSYQTDRESGRVKSGQSQGYTFEAKSGQKLNYKTSGNICVWVYAPDNQLITSEELPSTGRYTLQVAAMRGATTFELEMELALFSRSDFPKSICGDPKPTDSSAFPVNFYPVTLPYSQSNLTQAKSLFCRDAFQKINKDTGKKIIQIASFTSKERAEGFANLVNSKFSEATVGKAKTIYE